MYGLITDCCTCCKKMLDDLNQLFFNRCSIVFIFCWRIKIIQFF